MAKYLSICKTSFRQESKTIVNSLTAVVSFVIIIYIFQQLWRYIYTSGSSNTINGYTHEMMIWYMIMAEVLMYSINARSVTRAFSADIKSGKIAYQLNKPYNYYLYQIFQQIGSFIWKMVFLVPCAIIIGLVFVGPIANFSAVYILPMIICLMLAVLLSCIIYGCVGLFAFWIEESSPFTWIILKLQMLFGLFFPPEFFPVWLQPVIIYSPIYAIMSGPCKLVAGFSWELFYGVVISQAFYTLLFGGLGLLIYKIGTRKVNMNGG